MYHIAAAIFANITDITFLLSYFYRIVYKVLFSCLNFLKMYHFTAAIFAINTDETNYWTSQDKLEEICQRQLDHVIDEQLNSLSLPFSWSISDPSLFSSADEYQKLLETCRDAGTVIHALTGKV